MAQYFNVTILYTPSITYSKDFDEGYGAFEEDLAYEPFKFENNHIPYVIESHVNNILKYDGHGVEIAKQYAYDNHKVSEKLHF